MAPFVGLLVGCWVEVNVVRKRKKQTSSPKRCEQRQQQQQQIVDLKRMSAVVVDEVDETLKGKSRYERKKVHEHKKPGEILSRLLQDVRRRHNRNFQLIIASAIVNYQARRLVARIQGPERVLLSLFCYRLQSEFHSIHTPRYFRISRSSRKETTEK